MIKLDDDKATRSIQPNSILSVYIDRGSKRRQDMQRNRILFTILLLFASLVIFGCLAANQITALGPAMIQGNGNIVKEGRPVRTFNRIALAGSGEVILSQGEIESLTLEADDNLMEYIKAEVQNGTLILGLKDEARYKNIRPSQRIKFTVVAEDINGLNISGSGDMTSGAIETNSLDINISGSGDMEIESLLAERLNINVGGSGDVYIQHIEGGTVQVGISGSGKIELAGDVNEQDITISGSGQCLASDLKSQTGSIRISGSGGAFVWVVESLNANISGSGSVNYYGSPSTNLTSSGSGKIKRLGER